MISRKRLRMGVLIDDASHQKIQDRRVVLPLQQVVMQPPHRAEQTVHAGNPALPVDDENAVARRFERRAQLRRGLRQDVLDLPLLLDPARANQQPAPVAILDQPDRLDRPPQRAVGAQIQAFLGLDVGVLAAARILPIEDVLQRALDVEDGLAKQFVVRIAELLHRCAVGDDDTQCFRFDE